MNYIEANQLLVRYDRNENTIMLGGGAARRTESLLGTPNTFNFDGWGNVPKEKQIPENSDVFICDATYLISDIDAKIKALTKEAQENGIEIKVEEGFKISKQLVDKFFEGRQRIIESYSIKLDTIEKKIQETELKEGSDYFVVTELYSSKEKLETDTGLPAKLPDYVKGLLLRSFRAEYRGKADELIDPSAVRETYKEEEGKYSTARKQLFERVAQLTQSSKFLGFVEAKKIVK